jgi:hypothetical protein
MIPPRPVLFPADQCGCAIWLVVFRSRPQLHSRRVRFSTKRARVPSCGVPPAAHAREYECASRRSSARWRTAPPSPSRAHRPAIGAARLRAAWDLPVPLRCDRALMRRPYIHLLGLISTVVNFLVEKLRASRRTRGARGVPASGVTASLLSSGSCFALRSGYARPFYCGRRLGLL